ERATRLPAGLCVRNSLVRRNLLLGVQHHGAVWRHWGTWRVRSADPVLLVPCSLSRYVRVDYQLAWQKVVAAGIDWRAFRVGFTRTRAHAYQRISLGPAWHYSGGQHSSGASCDVHRRVWDVVRDHDREYGDSSCFCCAPKPETIASDSFFARGLFVAG